MKNPVNKLYQFLESHQVKEEFDSLFTEREPNTTLYMFIKNGGITPSNYINCCIRWTNAPSGPTYWSDLDTKWRNIVNHSNQSE